MKRVRYQPKRVTVNTINDLNEHEEKIYCQEDQHVSRVLLGPTDTEEIAAHSDFIELQLDRVVDKVVVGFAVPAANFYLGLSWRLGQSFKFVVVKQKVAKLIQGGEKKAAK